MTGQGRADAVLPAAVWQGLCDDWIGRTEIGDRVLILPPDMTRCYSYAGEITAYLYRKLAPVHTVRVMPAVGTHRQMTAGEWTAFFPGVPPKACLPHDWRSDTVSLGTIPAQVVRGLTEGRCDWEIETPVNRHLVDGSFDTVVSVGQVVPHEVVGMANYTKNLLVGVGGRDMINKSHMVSAICNIETILGNVDTPVRGLFDYGQKRFLDAIGVHFFLTVTTEAAGQAALHGLFIGQGRDTFEAAAALAQKTNITWLPKRVKKVVCWLDPAEFRSTWVGNKAIYRTRMAIADGGELVILAPGLCSFGENEEVDACIRSYGYAGTRRVLAWYDAGRFAGLEMVAAHLIHGSADGRFRITYATDPARMSRAEVEKAGFGWMEIGEALARYAPGARETGHAVTADGEPFYFVKAPAVGLWRSTAD